MARRTLAHAATVTALGLAFTAGACSSGDDPGATVPDASATDTAEPSDTGDDIASDTDPTGPTTTPTAPTLTTPTTLTTPATKPAPFPDDGATTPAAGSLYAPGTIETGLQPWIDEATADLADRLDVGASTIAVNAAVLVTWPDSSLGCPRPGMQYLQVLSDGAVIELVAGNAIYRYHAGEGRSPFLCPTPITEAPAPGL